MGDVPAHDLARTYICKQHGCTNEARSDRGVYAKCDEHIDRDSAERVRQARTGKTPWHANGGGSPSVGAGLVGELVRLRKLAANADRLTKDAEAATRKALAKKQEADRARAEFQNALRELSGQS